MKAYTSSSSSSATSVARGTIGSWSTSPDRSGPTEGSPGGSVVISGLSPKSSAMNGAGGRPWPVRHLGTALLWGTTEAGYVRGMSERDVGRLDPAHIQWSLCPARERRAAPAPQQVAKPEQDDDRADRAEAADDVVDRRHEVVRCVGERGREAPAVGLSGLSWRPGFADGHGDAAVGRVVLDVCDLTLQLLDLLRDLAELVLHGDDVGRRLCLAEQGQHRVALSLLVGQARLEVDVLRADVVAADVLVL